MSGHSYRLDADRLREQVPLVREAADLASARLGYGNRNPG